MNHPTPLTISENLGELCRQPDFDDVITLEDLECEVLKIEEVNK